jgi:hypothetical protein
MDAFTKIRVKQELKAVGVTWYGMQKFAIRYLPEIIGMSEHICGAVYGRYADNGGNLKFNAGLLVATNKRVIFLDHKPGYTRMDEIAYDAVGGVELSTVVKSTVKVKSAAGDYQISYANPRCSKTFVDYVDKKRMFANNNQ